MPTIDARLKELEQMAKARKSGDLWVQMRDNRVRVDRAKRGKEREFKTTYEAAKWLEKQINEAPGAIGSVVINDLCDLYQDSDQLREGLAPYISQDFDLGACLFGDLKTNGPADLRLWLIASKINELRLYDYIGQDITDDQLNTISALCVIFSGGKEPTLTIKKFLALVSQVGRINA